MKGNLVKRILASLMCVCMVALSMPQIALAEGLDNLTIEESAELNGNTTVTEYTGFSFTDTSLASGLYLKVGDTKTIETTTTTTSIEADDDAIASTDGTVTLSSGNTNAVTVEGNAITAAAAGKSTITGTMSAYDTNQGKAVTYTQTFVAYVGSISITTYDNKDTSSFDISDKEVQLKAVTEGLTDADKTVSWSSSDTNVASVSDSGVVTFKNKGITTITVETSHYSASKIITILPTVDDVAYEITEDGTITLKWNNTSGAENFEINQGTLDETVTAESGKEEYTYEDTRFKDKDIAADPVTYSVFFTYKYDDSNSYTVTKTLTIYAGQKASIEYILPSGATNDEDNPASAIANAEVTLKDPVMTGYAFAGWFETRTGSEGSYVYSDQVTDGKFTVQKASYTLYAKFTANKFNLVYSGCNPTDGTMATEEYDYDDTITVKNCAYSKLGYAFVKWNTKADGTGTSYVSGDTLALTDVPTTNGSNLVLYAIWSVESYTINYELDGGTNDSKNPTVFTGDSTTWNLYPATKTGYTFTNWTLSDKTSVVTQITVSSAKAGLTLYANYTPVNYIIKFDGNGSTSGELSSMNCTYDTSSTLPSGTEETIFKRTGCILSGWNTQADGKGTSYTLGESVSNLVSTSQTITLYAVWTGIEYSITYSNVGDTSDDDLTGNGNNPTEFVGTSAAYTLKNPTMTGYTFDGWYSGDTKVTKLIPKDDTTPVVLTGKWTPITYMVRFEPNGASIGNVDSIIVQYDQEFTMPSNDTGFTYPGYSFKGWYNTQSSTTGITPVQYTIGEKYKNLSAVNGSYVTIYAWWDAKTYTITYNLAADETNSADNKTEFNSDQLPFTLKNASKPGYTFDHWENATGDTISAITVTNADGLALTPKFSPILYTINYMVNDSLYQNDYVYYDAESTMISAPPVEVITEDYRFKEWNTQADGSGTGYNADTKYTLNLTTTASAKVALYAILEKNYYYITYELNGGENASGNLEKIYYKDTSFTLCTPTKEGYRFTGWKDASGNTITSVTSESASAGLTLIACWTPLEYTIAFDGNGYESGSTASIATTYTAEVILPENGFTRTYYKFMGWNTKSDGTGTTYQAGDTVKNLTDKDNSTVTLYAMWAYAQFEITYVLDGGVNDENNPKIYDGTKGDYILQPATKTGYAFKGWVDASQSPVTKITFDNAENLILYAKFTKIVFTIDYHANGIEGLVERNYDYDETAYIIKCSFTRDGYSFLYWNTKADNSGTKYNPGDDITNLTSKEETIHLYAIWSDGSGSSGGTDSGDSDSGNSDDDSEDEEITGTFTVSSIADQAYTGKAVKPEITVTAGTTTLKEGTDYTVVYLNNIKAGTATVVVNGKGNFSGYITKTFNIVGISIQDNLDALSDYSVVYKANKVQKPGFTIIYKGKKLTAGKDYTLSWTNESGIADKGCMAEGTYPVTIKAKGNYSGSVTKNFVIASSDKLSIANAKITGIKAVNVSDWTNSSGEIEAKPLPTVTYTGVGTLVKDTDYTLTWTDNDAAGTGTLTVTGTGSKYVGSKTVTFTINGIPIRNVTFEDLESSYEYTGSAIEPEFSLSYGGKYLKLGSDYSVAYANNTNAKTASIIVTGMGGYSGTVKKTFKIKAYDLADADENLTVSYYKDLRYAKGGSKPAVTVKFKGNTLTEKTDFKIEYHNNTKIADAYDTNSNGDLCGPYFIIVGMGNFKNKYENCYFSISEQEIKNTDIFISDKVYSKKSGAFYSTPTIYDCNSGVKLVAGKDYEKTFSYYHEGTALTKKSCPKTGDTISVTITGMGCYTGTTTVTYRITSYDISKASVKVLNQKYYTGSDVKLSASDLKITMKISGKTVTLSSSDYEIVSYSNNTGKGTATAVIHGLGNYGGYKTIKFSIKAKSLK